MLRINKRITDFKDCSTFLESKTESWLGKKQINAKGIIMFSGPN